MSAWWDGRRLWVTRPSHLCDVWVGDLGVVGVSSIFGLIRGSGAFAAVLPTFVLVSRMHRGTTIVSGLCVRPSYSLISRLLVSSLSLGISSLICPATQCM